MVLLYTWTGDSRYYDAWVGRPSCVQPRCRLRANRHSLHYCRDCRKCSAQERNKPRWERDPGRKRCWNVLSISLRYKGHLCLMPLSSSLQSYFENWLEFQTLISSHLKLFHSLMQKKFQCKIANLLLQLTLSSNHFKNLLFDSQIIFVKFHLLFSHC
jgi:hypothetical protein